MKHGGGTEQRWAGRWHSYSVLAALLFALLAAPALAQIPSLPDAQRIHEQAERLKAAASITPPQLTVQDTPGDDGSSLLLLVDNPPAGYALLPEVEQDGQWLPTESAPLPLDLARRQADYPQYFGFAPPAPEQLVIPVSGFQSEAGGGSIEAGQSYNLRLVLIDSAGERALELPAGSVTVREEWFNPARANNLIICAVLSFIILGSIAAARRNPNLFIRRINGLEAVDEAVGRATEMGKPVFHINGLDGLTVLSTLAGVNILGRIARVTANYETQLVVPAFDPVVLNVSQEVVRQAYLEAGRPDAYRADDIFFVTDQQFSYVASVCGMMLRDRPAAIFLLGSFYAESLMLAETGASTGAIQIAGTDQQAQLPFFITACDYTLIGEELYAASAYLSREPLLLGSLKGQDIGKALIALLIVAGVISTTVFKSEWLTHLFTAL